MTSDTGERRTMTVRVLLVDDQEIIRMALRMLIDRNPDMKVVAEAINGGDAVAKAFAHKPDVVVMDVRMPGMTGVEATGRILREWPHTESKPRILVLTTFDLDEYVYSALRNGASGFLLKNTLPEQFIEAIRVVAAGDAILAPAVTQRLIQTVAGLPPTLLGLWAENASSPVPGPPDALGSLTERELDVLILVGNGLSNAEIATRLDLSESNVKSRVNRILGRLGVTNRVLAAIMVHNAGLLSAPRHGEASG
jgi:DNA-binding NarL/FixJ family response regulator